MRPAPWLRRPHASAEHDRHADPRQTGPMSVADLHERSASPHPRYGYYTGGRPLGAEGDFITAPEISQMFGELIGFCLVNLWQQMGQPTSFTLLELGPGRGTLMADVLRAAAAPRLPRRADLWLVETNPAAEGASRQSASAATSPTGPTSSTPSATPRSSSSPTNSSTPCRSASSCAPPTAGPSGWSASRDGKRAFGLSPTPIPDSAMPPEFATPPIGAVLRSSASPRPTSCSASAAASRAQGGAPRHRLRLRRDRRPATPCRRCAATPTPIPSPRPARPTSPPTSISPPSAKPRPSAGLAVAAAPTQGDFLPASASASAPRRWRRANPGRSRRHRRAPLERLTSPDQMGTLFKGSAPTPPASSPPAFRMSAAVRSPAAARRSPASATPSSPAGRRLDRRLRLASTCRSPWATTPDAVVEQPRRAADALGGFGSRLAGASTRSIPPASSPSPTGPTRRSPEADAVVTTAPACCSACSPPTARRSCSPIPRPASSPPPTPAGRARSAASSRPPSPPWSTSAPTRPHRAAIGPCISGANYEVGLEFAARSLALDTATPRTRLRPAGQAASISTCPASCSTALTPPASASSTTSAATPAPSPKRYLLPPPRHPHGDHYRPADRASSGCV